MSEIKLQYRHNHMREPKFRELRESMAVRQARNAREYKYVCHQVMVWPPFGSAWRNEWSM